MRERSHHLRLLADGTRLRILHLLADEPLTVAELQEVLDLSQSSVSGHLGKLKRSGYLHDIAEGSSHRYRVREDLGDDQAACWEAVHELTGEDPDLAADRERLARLRTSRCTSWVDRVAGALHREYAPGRSGEALMHAFLQFAEFGRCVDVGAGDGALVELLAPRAEELVCVDPNDAMVAAGEARIARLKIGNARYEQAGAEALPLADASHDSVCFVQSLQYVTGPKTALAEAARVLRPGGRLLVLTLQAHDFTESERYGHRHRGFEPRQLRRWATGMGERACYALPAEPRPPRFVPLVYCAEKEER